MSSEVDRMHVVRECREKCAEIGYSGDAFRKCVDECVKDVLGSNY